MLSDTALLKGVRRAKPEISSSSLVNKSREFYARVVYVLADLEPFTNLSDLGANSPAKFAAELKKACDIVGPGVHGMHRNLTNVWKVPRIFIIMLSFTTYSNMIL